MAKSEFDATMERIRASLDQTFRILAETKRIHDGWDAERAERRTGRRTRHLHLVPPLEEGDDA